jgi:hypothetical protein
MLIFLKKILKKKPSKKAHVFTDFRRLQATSGSYNY